MDFRMSKTEFINISFDLCFLIFSLCRKSIDSDWFCKLFFNKVSLRLVRDVL